MRTQRKGFTLVEMLVVVGVIVLLLGLAVAILPGISSKRAAARGADQLQGWLVQARSKAQRDQVATGLRLFVDPDFLVRRLEFVQQADPVFLRSGSQRTALQVDVSPHPLPPYDPANPVEPVITGRLGAFDGPADLLRIGDYFEVKNGDLQGFYRVDSLPDASGAMRLAGDPEPIGVTTDFVLVRRWRSLAGEPILEMPKGVVIDVDKNAFPPPPPPDRDNYYSRALPGTGGNVVFMFAPSGRLMDSLSARPVLWVRSEDGKGQPTLISVTASSGAVSAHPVYDEKAPGMNNRLLDPFRFVDDGLGGGL